MSLYSGLSTLSYLLHKFHKPPSIDLIPNIDFLKHTKKCCFVLVVCKKKKKKRSKDQSDFRH